MQSSLRYLSDYTIPQPVNVFRDQITDTEDMETILFLADACQGMI
jgi:hypothetical protein